MHRHIAVAVGEVVVPLGVKVHIGGLVEGLGQLPVLVHQILGIAAPVVAGEGLGGEDAVVDPGQVKPFVHIAAGVAGVVLLPEGAHHLLGLQIHLDGVVVVGLQDDDGAVVGHLKEVQVAQLSLAKLAQIIPL